MTAVGVFIRNIQQRPEALRAGSKQVHFKVDLTLNHLFPVFCCIFAASLSWIKNICASLPHYVSCFWFPFSSWTMQLMPSDLKQEAYTGRNFWLIEIMNSSVCQRLSHGVKGQHFPENRQELSYPLKSARCGSAAMRVCSLWSWRSRRYSMAWLEPNRVRRPMRGRCSGCGYRCAMLASRQHSMLER